MGNLSGSRPTALITVDKYNVSTPAEWHPGDDAIVPISVFPRRSWDPTRVLVDT
ncbi:MAG: hypothetical protein KAT48_00375 [Bacteroidales bacterium]|nr:hypothetical protein [Bacteroidales bacterium]